jgi:regulator of protease activity HflC (stomatin/prohibitin superfamily)
MTAERERRAEVTKAEGDKSAAILQAEGEKISRILRAEAERDAEVARAEGRKRATLLDAEAKAEATRLVFDAINSGGGATPEVLALRYMETLQELGKGDNKMFVPYEATAALGSIATLKEVFAREGGTDKARPTPSAAALSAQALTRSVTTAPPAMPVRNRPPLPSEE